MGDSAYVHLLRARVRADWQYRASFTLLVATTFVFSFFDFLAVIFIFDNVSTLGGWAFGESAFLYGTSAVSFNLANLFIAPVDTASAHIKRGTFDQLLVRPLGTIVQLSAGDFELRRVGRLLQGLVVLAIALRQVEVAWTPLKVSVLLMMLVSGAVIFAGIWVTMAALAFWVIENRGLANSMTFSGNFLTERPVDLFAGWLRRVALIVPLAFVNYLPAAWLLDRDDAYGAPDWMRLASPVVAVLSVAVASGVWRTAVRHYRSTGT